MLGDSGDWAVLGACLMLAAAVALFIFYIQPDASDLAPHRTKLDQLLERRDTIYDNLDRKSTRLNSSHGYISYAVFCLKKKTHPSPKYTALPWLPHPH